MKCKKLCHFVLGLIFLQIVFAASTKAQYSMQDANFAKMSMKNNGILKRFISLMDTDPYQNVANYTLMCVTYDLYNPLALRVKNLEQQRKDLLVRLSGLERKMRQRKSQTTGVSTSNNKLLTMVSTLVNEKIKTVSSQNNWEELNKSVLDLSEKGKQKTEKIKELDRRVTGLEKTGNFGSSQTQVIAIASAVFSGIAAVFFASR